MASAYLLTARSDKTLLLILPRRPLPSDPARSRFAAYSCIRKSLLLNNLANRRQPRCPFSIVFVILEKLSDFLRMLGSDR